MNNLKRVFKEEVDKEMKQVFEKIVDENDKVKRKEKTLWGFLKYYCCNLFRSDNDFAFLQFFTLLLYFLFTLIVNEADKMIIGIFLLTAMQVSVLSVAMINFQENEKEKNELKIKKINVMDNPISKKMLKAMVLYIRNKETLSLLLSSGEDHEELKLTYGKVKKFIHIEESKLSEKIITTLK